MQRTLKKIMASLLCLAVLFSLCSCKEVQTVIDTLGIGDKENFDPGIDRADFSVPYLRTDSLNPYKATETMNKYIVKLLYDSLFTVNEHFEVQNQIAQSYSLAEKKLSVYLKSGLTFTDGTAITANDVVYSFGLAKKCTTYIPYLESITEATASGTGCIVFTLSHSSSGEAANLIFPIIKASSTNDDQAAEQTDSLKSLPTGSGRYSIITENGKKYLSANKARLGNYHPIYNKIGLVDVTDKVSFAKLFDMNEIDFYCDNFDEGEYSKTNEISSRVDLTNFVYLGINSHNSALNNARVRRAIALALDRAELASVSFASYAEAAVLPFHPSSSKLDGITQPTLKNKNEAAIKLLEENGFDKVSDFGIRYSESSSLNFTLLVNNNNAFRRSLARGIQQALEKVNIRVTINEASYDSYVSAIKSGNFDLYIGETVLSNTFGLSRFFAEDGSLSYGIDSACNTAQLYAKYQNGEAELRNFVDAFAEELPFVPIAFRQGITTASGKFKNEISTLPNDCFANIHEWTV